MREISKSFTIPIVKGYTFIRVGSNIKFFLPDERSIFIDRIVALHFDTFFEWEWTRSSRLIVIVDVVTVNCTNSNCVNATSPEVSCVRDAGSGQEQSVVYSVSRCWASWTERNGGGEGEAALAWGKGNTVASAYALLTHTRSNRASASERAREPVHRPRLDGRQTYWVRAQLTSAPPPSPPPPPVL